MGRFSSTLAVTVALPTPPCSPCVPVRVTPRPGRPADRRSCLRAARQRATVLHGGTYEQQALPCGPGLARLLSDDQGDDVCPHRPRGNRLLAWSCKGARLGEEGNSTGRCAPSGRCGKWCAAAPLRLTFTLCPWVSSRHGCRTRRASRRRAGKQAPHATGPHAAEHPAARVSEAPASPVAWRAPALGSHPSGHADAPPKATSRVLGASAQR
jgi:hypothetical protein